MTGDIGPTECTAHGLVERKGGRMEVVLLKHYRPTAHLVLTPAEAREFARSIMEFADLVEAQKP